MPTRPAPFVVAHLRSSVSPSPALAGEGRGEGSGNCDRPHPALRATFSREEREKGPVPVLTYAAG
jgi:hypothetical protein